MTDFVPQKKVKYFFGYYNHFGNAAPMMWAEEDGLVVGGIPSPILQKHEITEAEFQPDVSLASLCKKYPIELDMRTLVPKDTQTDLT